MIGFVGSGGVIGCGRRGSVKCDRGVPCRPWVPATVVAVTLEQSTKDVTGAWREPPADAMDMRMKIASLVLFDEFRRPEESETFPSLLVRLLDNVISGNSIKARELYGRLWVSVCGARGKGWLEEILSCVYLAGGGNPFTDAAFEHDILPDRVANAAAEDLYILESIAHLPPDTLARWVGLEVDSRSTWHSPPMDKATGTTEILPQYVDDVLNKLREGGDWGLHVHELAAAIKKLGVGVTGEYYGLSFVFGQLTGVISRREALTSKPARFVGVEDIYAKLKRNTEGLVRGVKAQNCLLYGPPGCGKSSMVRSLVGLYGQLGLRLVEIGKNELSVLPEVVSMLSKYPQKFIIFVDDLAYSGFEEEAMRTGKAALEGSLRAACDNVVIYVTSNRRHPAIENVSEETSDRLAFSQRFGLTLQFPGSGREQFDAIVSQLALDAGVAMPRAELKRRSLLWAFGEGNLKDANGLSGRTARQFIDYIVADQALTAAGLVAGAMDWDQFGSTPWYACVDDDGQ